MVIRNRFSARDKKNFESESLVDDTDNILERLSAYLELKRPLKSKYKTFKYTGQARKGDTSEFIKKAIFKETEKNIRRLLSQRI